MIHKLLNKLEDPNIPLLGPNVEALKFWGLLLPSNPFWKIFYMFLHVNLILFILTEWVDVWFIISDLNLLLNNLKVTLLAAVGVSKVCTFLYWQKEWTGIIDYVTAADKKQRSDNNPKKQNIIDKYTKYCRSITGFYIVLMVVTVTIMITSPVFVYVFVESYRINVSNGTAGYLPVISSWVPFNKDTPSGYLVASLYQSYAAIYGGGWIVFFDSVAISIMIFFKGELELLKHDSANIFIDESIETHACLKELHRRHVALISCCELFDSCLSPIMFLYMFVCSVMLCCTAFQISTETSAIQRLMAIEYLLFGVAQLFLYCWHSNEVYYTSLDLMSGPYESIWWNLSSRQQKVIIILISQFKKKIIFTAGPFANLTVSTFVNIVKGAYSYYTLINQ